MLTRWETLTKNDFESKTGSIAAICFSSIEQHASHLPVGTDSLLGRAVAEQAAEQAACEVVLLPQVCYGYSPHHTFAKGYITIQQRVLIDYAKNIARCVYENGFRKLVMINAHGGNRTYLAAAVNELGEELPDLDAVFLQYWDLASDTIAKVRRSPQGGMGHAGEFETGLMMHLHPQLVRQEDLQSVPPVEKEAYYAIDLLHARKQYYRFVPFNHYNQDGMIGQPQLASAENGKIFFESAVSALAAFLDYFAQKG